jgi:hypothetical protein
VNWLLLFSIRILTISGNKVINLNDVTITKPSKVLILLAEVGNDVYNEDPTNIKTTFFLTVTMRNLKSSG